MDFPQKAGNLILRGFKSATSKKTELKLLLDTILNQQLSDVKRPKTKLAIENVLKSLKRDEIHELRCKWIFVHATPIGVFGYSIYFHPKSGDKIGNTACYKVPIEINIIHFSQFLEACKQEFVEHIAAHEFAHVLLETRDEEKADNRAEQWGFPHKEPTWADKDTLYSLFPKGGQK